MIRFALRFDDAVLVERGIQGRELWNAPSWATARIQASVVGEIVPGNEFYDYAGQVSARIRPA